MQRVLIIGPCGAGKSTLARRLGPILELPVIHLDALNWQPGWVTAPDDVFRAMLLEAAQAPRWIIDGNYGGTLTLRLPFADAVILLDFPRWRCVGRVVKRFITHVGKTRPDMGPGCPEKLDWEFMDFVWHWFETSRPRLLARLKSVRRDQRLIVLRTPREVEEFVARLTRSRNKLMENTY